ncbi:hypothetical protein EOM09_05255, partial [bacterium]|nr:hypothetical protein [bacterium]
MKSKKPFQLNLKEKQNFFLERQKLHEKLPPLKTEIKNAMTELSLTQFQTYTNFLLKIGTSLFTNVREKFTDYTIYINKKRNILK